MAGRSVTLEAWGKGTDDYPRRHIRSHVTLDDINEAILYNPRNCYQNYNAATNSSERMLHTYMGTLLPKLRNVSYSTAGELSPLLNDPTCRTIGMGTRIFLCGARGYVSWQGTQFNTSKPVNEHGIPIGGARTVAAIGNLREMSTDYLRAAYYEKYGVSLFVGVGIPIPLLDEELAHDVSIRNEQITTNILDFGEEERPIGRPTTPNCAAVRSRCGGSACARLRGEPAQGARDRRDAQRLDRPRRIPPHGTRTTHARPFDGQGAESRRRITANKEKHMTTKVILYFPSDATDKAVTYDLVKRYDLRINILRAEIEAGRSGSLLVELTGEEPMVREGVAYLERNGVTVSPVASKIAYDRDRCIDCGNCALALLPAGAYDRCARLAAAFRSRTLHRPANSASKAALWVSSISNSPKPEPWSTSSGATGAAWGGMRSCSPSPTAKATCGSPSTAAMRPSWPPARNTFCTNCAGGSTVTSTATPPTCAPSFPVCRDPTLRRCCMKWPWRPLRQASGR